MSGPGETHWRRLDARVIWIDVVQTLVSVAPLLVGTLILGVETGRGGLIAIAAFGGVGAVADAWRWVFTRYRITDDHVERQTGVFVKTHRSLRRDRVRSVDTHAKLRHRLAGLRVVEVGAGQRSAVGEAAFELDAIRADEAQRLQQLLLRTSPVASPPAASSNTSSESAGDVVARDDAGATAAPAAAPAERSEDVLWRFQPGWVVYNLFSVWVFIVAAGLIWGGQWVLSSLGFDLVSSVIDLRDWASIGWGWTAALALAISGAVGVVAMAVIYFETNWNFELARVHTHDGIQLRTRHGLFTTREVYRDVARMRGVQIAEPVLWRWMGVTDTTVITTGLDEWAMSQPTAIIPRGPIGAARKIAAQALDTDDAPLDQPLRAHPRVAFYRRLRWAAGISLLVTAVLGVLAITDVIESVWVWAGPASLPVTCWAAWVAYRALGHATAERHVVIRAGLVSRATSVLQRSAVSTIAVRESVLQRRLGLRTVSAMTAAGYGAYEAPDMEAADAVAFAIDAAPGLLAPFLIAEGDAAEADSAVVGPVMT